MPPRKRKQPEKEAGAEKEAPPPKRAAPKRGAAAAAAAPKRSAAKAAPTGARQAAAKARKIAKEFAVSLETGHCFAFGSNPFGALGLGEDVVEKPRAAHVEMTLPAGPDGGAPRPAEIVQVVAGGMHTAALDRGGAVFTWGVNDEGALGRPTAGSAWEGTKDAGKEDPALPGLARLPEGAARVVQLAAGDGFTFALTEDGAIWGWGCFKDDGSGAAGFPGAPHGAKLQRLPAKVYAPADARAHARRISAGARHMAALTRRGEVLTWGMGSQGQLGRVAPFNNDSFPPLPELLAPAPVPGVAAAVGNDVADVVCGPYSTFVISRRGAVAAWGLNNAGQLALPLAGDAAAAAAGGGEGQEEQQQQQQQAEEGQGHFHWAPRFVEALPKVAAIAGGEHHTLALTRGGVVLSFGAPTYGMLGRSNVDAAASASANHTPHPVDLADGLEEEAVVGIAAGTNVSAAVTRQGNLYLWGSNVNYQMAKGLDEDDNLAPTRMRRHKAFGQRRVMAAAFGGQHGALLASDDAAAAAGDVGAGPSAAAH